MSHLFHERPQRLLFLTLVCHNNVDQETQVAGGQQSIGSINIMH